MTNSLRPTLPLLATCLLLAAGCAPEPNPDIGRYEPIDCPVAWPAEASEFAEVTCGRVSVPERHARPEGPVIQIAVARFESRNPEAGPDPLVLNSGGPGDSNFEAFFPVLASPLGAALLANRDVVLVELRGLLHSEPNLVCEEVFEAQSDMVSRNVRAEEANALLLDGMRRCQARFVAEGIDLPAYNNTETASDIALILGELGYDQFNLFGSSAGTMVAQELMRQHGDRLRAVVLNAAVPNAPVLFEHMFVNAAVSLRRHFALCEQDPACAAAYPDLEHRFLALLDTLNANPVSLPVTNSATSEETTLLLNGDKLSSWMFASMYWNTQIARTIDRFVKRDFTQVQRDAGIFFPLSRFAYALGYTVVTSLKPDFRAADTGIPDGYETFANGFALFFSPRLMEATRTLWTDETSGRDQPGPLQSDVPTLLMNGALDHVIPSTLLADLTSGLSNGHAFVFEGVAHSPVDAGECGLGLMMAFLADPTAAPDASCVAEFRHTIVLPDDPDA